MSETPYPHLFSPLRIGGVTVRNRLMQTAHVKLFSVHGVDSPRDLAYQVERAKGGIGLIVTGNRLIHPTSTSQGTARSYSWGYLRRSRESDRRLTAAVHEHGAAIFVQLNHLGAQASSESGDDLRVLFAPSAVKSPTFGETAKEMEIEDIRELTEWWARSAEYCRDSGFDGVEVHISHSYLLHEFFSPLYNHRTDEYGGSLENRLRFACEVVSAVRQRVGPDYVVGVRLSLTDLYDGSLTVDDAIAAVPLLRAAGPIDFVNVSASGYHNIHLGFAPSDIPDGYLLEHVARLKPTVPDLPVFAVGGLKDAAQAEDIVASGTADMVAMTREQIADAHFANKVREGRDAEVYHCVRLNQGCFGRVMRGMPLGCTVNPETGREAKFGAGTLTPAGTTRRWLVVGGGPAGMKAAEILAKRGHDVTLLEREDSLGGQVDLARRTPGRESFEWIVRDLEAQMRRNGVDIRLGVEATADLVAELAPDGVIVATGAAPSTTGVSIVAPFVDRLAGVDQHNVVTSWDAIADRAEIGACVVVLDDEGTRATAGVCEVLLDRGRRVELVTRWHALFPATMLTLDMAILHRRTLEKGLTYRLHTWARRVDGASVTVYNLYTGAEETLEADTVVLATGPVANDALYRELRASSTTPVHRIGDCVAPRKLDHAIYEGYVAGRELFSTEERYIDDEELYRVHAGAPAVGLPA
jgi:mycofactocin system FadH/OYE family oxidoreductase 2